MFRATSTPNSFLILLCISYVDFLLYDGPRISIEVLLELKVLPLLTVLHNVLLFLLFSVAGSDAFGICTGLGLAAVGLL